jgi:hypothetical protein
MRTVPLFLAVWECCCRHGVGTGPQPAARLEQRGLSADDMNYYCF